ncbi:hypothetical protein [Nostoc sp.]|uniref:hypothetical protein n=1 Tax=Nostoc sp. TaxID=1180 RepID=UPI002FF74AC3
MTEEGYNPAQSKPDFFLCVNWERSLVNPHVKNSSYIQSNQDAAEDNNQIGTNNKDLS